MKNRFISLLLVSCTLLPLSGCKSREEVHSKIEDAKAILRGEVRTEPVTVRVLAATSPESGISTRTYVGKVESSRSITLSAPNPGTLTSFGLHAGDAVKAGQVVCKIESQSVESALRMAESTLKQAKDGYDRLQKVYDSGAVADVKMVEIETKLAQAQASYDAAKEAYDRCSVKAPFSGVVSEVFVTDGVDVGIAEPIVRIVDLGSLEIHFPVPESELASVKVGDRAQVHIPAIDRTGSGRVSSKGVVASALSHNYDCVLSGLDGLHGLMPGMACKLSLRAASSAATVIPASAVMTDKAGRYVWTVSQDGTVGKTYITVSGYSGNGVVVDGGLSEGLLVIVEGSRKVSSGMKAKVIE